MFVLGGSRGTIFLPFVHEIPIWSFCSALLLAVQETGAGIFRARVIDVCRWADSIRHGHMYIHAHLLYIDGIYRVYSNAHLHPIRSDPILHHVSNAPVWLVSSSRTYVPSCTCASLSSSRSTHQHARVVHPSPYIHTYINPHNLRSPTSTPTHLSPRISPIRRYCPMNAPHSQTT